MEFIFSYFIMLIETKRIFFIFLFSCISEGQKSQEYKILQNIFRHYNRNIRPSSNSSQPVTIKLGITLVMINDLDEKNEILTTIVWLNQEWMDGRLAWNNSNYESVDKIRTPCTKIWLPDIVLFNSVQEKFTEYRKSLVTIYNNGKLIWQPIVTMHSFCRLDISYFPFDDQICILSMGSWAYSKDQLDILKLKPNIDLSSLIEHGEWNIFNTSSKRTDRFHPSTNETYSEISFILQLKRRNLYYIINVTFPCIMLSMLTLVGFILPPESGEKVTLSLTVLLLYSFFLLMVTEKMPATSEFTPLIGIYITINMGLTSISVIIVVLVIKIHHRKSQNEVLCGGISNQQKTRSILWLGFEECLDFESPRELVSRNYYQTLARKIEKYVGIIFSVLTIIITLFLIVLKPCFRQNLSTGFKNLSKH